MKPIKLAKHFRLILTWLTCGLTFNPAPFSSHFKCLGVVAVSTKICATSRYVREKLLACNTKATTPPISKFQRVWPIIIPVISGVVWQLPPKDAARCPSAIVPQFKNCDMAVGRPSADGPSSPTGADTIFKKKKNGLASNETLDTGLSLRKKKSGGGDVWRLSVIREDQLGEERNAKSLLIDSVRKGEIANEKEINSLNHGHTAFAQIGAKFEGTPVMVCGAMEMACGLFR